MPVLGLTLFFSGSRACDANSENTPAEKNHHEAETSNKTQLKSSYNGSEIKTSLNKSQNPKIAIIIDDLGYNFRLGLQTIALRFPITVAIIPFTPHAKTLAHLASANTKEIIVHAPMQPIDGEASNRNFHVDMSKPELNQLLTQMVLEIPQAKGLNNHEGSLFSQDPLRTNWLLSFLEQKNLYFVDSRTSPDTTFPFEASRIKIQFTERDVFLDNSRELNAIRTQLFKLQEIAVKTGKAVAIGHPYPETLQVLREELPRFKEKGIDIVFASKTTKLQPKSSNYTQAALFE